MEELAGSQSRAELILAFLALLFLFRQKAIMLSQSVRFGKIEIRKFEEHGGR
jgi:chromatin segregation and condensation protein Rec8/ScpA/Scc1 (kleisin family)